MRGERVNEIETLSLTQIFSWKIPKISFIENFQQQLTSSSSSSSSSSELMLLLILGRGHSNFTTFLGAT